MPNNDVIARRALALPEFALSLSKGSNPQLLTDCFGTPALVRLKPHGARENQ